MKIRSIALILTVGCVPQTGHRTPEGSATDSTAAVDSAADSNTGDTVYPYTRLSTYGLFTGALADLTPAAGVLPYDVVIRLWSDGADKDRFVQLPPGGDRLDRQRRRLDVPGWHRRRQDLLI